MAVFGSSLKLPAWSIPLAILIAGWLLFGWRVGQRGLWSSHEGRAAQNAQTILDTNNWLLPTLYTEEVEEQKPPLYYWLVALASKLSGGPVSAWSIRVPATLSAIAGLVLVYWFGKQLWDSEAGVIAAIILATTTRYAWLARVGRIDMPLTVTCLLALYCFYHSLGDPDAQADQSRKLSWWFYLAVGVGTLLKGPVAWALALLPVLTYLWLSGQPVVPGLHPGWRATWRRCRFLPGLALVTLLSAPWFVYASWKSGGSYFWEFFVYHNLQRALGTSEALKSGPIWFYVPRLLVDSFPWSVLLPAVAVTLWRERPRPGGDRWSRPQLFLLSWVLAQFVFLTLVSFKRADYLLPVFPAVALLLSGWLRDRFERFARRSVSRPVGNPRRRARLIRVSAVVLVALTTPLLLWALIEFCKKGVVKTIFRIDLVDRYLNSTDHFMMGHLERLLRANWPLLGIGIVVVIGGLWLLHTGWHTRRNRWLVAGLALPWTVCFLFQVHVLLPALDPLREMSHFAEVIRTLATRERPIYYFGKFDADLVFHAGRPARVIGDWEEMVQLGQLPEPCFVVMKASQLQWVERDTRMANWTVIANNHQVALGDHCDARVLLTNQPYAVVDCPRQGPGDSL